MASNLHDEAKTEKRQSEVVEWLNSILPEFNMSLDASNEELQGKLIDGVVICSILQNISPRYSEEIKKSVHVSPDKRLEFIKRFISAIEQMGLPIFKLSDIEQGQMTPVINCLWYLKDRIIHGIGNGKNVNLQNKHGQNSVSEVPTSRTFDSFTAKLTTLQSGQNFYDVFQLKQGQYCDLPPARIYDIMKSNSFDNAPTKSLLSVVNGILDESIERKNGEIPQRVACLLRKVVQEIERRISTQTDHIRNQNNMIKAREEKYQSRIRVLETLATDTSKETQIEMKKIDDRTKEEDEDLVKLIKEKKNNEKTILELQRQLDTLKQQIKQQEVKSGKDMDVTKSSYLGQFEQLNAKDKDTEMQLIEKIKEIETIKSSYQSQYEQLEAKAKDTEMKLLKKIKDMELTKVSYDGQHEQKGSQAMDTEIQLSEKIKEIETIKSSYQLRFEQLEAKAKDTETDLLRKIKDMELTKGSYDGQYEQKESKATDTEMQLSEKIKEIEKIKSSYQLRYEQLEANAKDTETNLLKKIKDMELTKGSYDEQYAQLESKAKDSEMQLREKIKEMEANKTSYTGQYEQIESKLTSTEIKLQQSIKDMEAAKASYQVQYEQLEAKAKDTEMQLFQKVKESETLLIESKRKFEDLEALSKSKLQKWTRKENLFQNFISSLQKSVQESRVSTVSIKQEVVNSKKRWSEEVVGFGKKLKVLTDAAENYHKVVVENRRLYNEVLELKGNIRVYCRIRPFLSGENRKRSTIGNIGEDGEVVLVNPAKPGKDGEKMFKFNKVFGPAATQEQVYVDTQPLVRSVLDGYNVCIFAYGQTGSGKTYTMIGPNSASENEWGVNYRALNDLFQISKDRQATIKYEVGVQMIEIYNEQVRDLLSADSSQKKLGVLSASQSNGIAVPDATMIPVTSTTDVLDLMNIGLNNRAVSSTSLNERSSRSHSTMTVHVQGLDLKTGATLRGSLHLVDLAGSERVDRSEVTGDRLKEAQHINKSLAALGDVIFSLSQKSSHVPYRNSKLTQVLQSSLGGHAKTLMFVQINPDIESYFETLSTLKFAERVSGVELGTAQKQKEGKDTRDLIEQVASLKDTIAKKDEEIERLQMLKGSKSKPKDDEKLSTLKHSTSSPMLNGAIQHNRKSSNGTTTPNNKETPDLENYSEYSGENPETDVLDQSQVSGEDALDNENMDLGDADSEERSSDISEDNRSDGEEDVSVGSAIEPDQIPEHGKSETPKDTKSKVAARVAKPSSLSSLRKVGQVIAATKRLKDPVKPLSSGLKKGTTGSPTLSSLRSLRSPTSTSSKPLTSPTTSSLRRQH